MEPDRPARSRPATARWRALAASLLAVAAAGPALGQPLRPETRSYPVGSFEIEYVLPHPDQPSVDVLLGLEVELRVTPGGLMPPHPATRNVRFRLSEVPERSRFYAPGLRHVSREIVAEFTRRGIGGVLVTVPELEEGSGRDLRPVGDERLLLRIWTGRVQQVATIADGERFGDLGVAERSDRPEHAFILRDSPVKAGGDQGLLRIDEVENYAFKLSRHPGRRVDAKLSPGDFPGTSRLDYHVGENKPWLAYAQISNTGTEATTLARERFGLLHYQLTGHDDVLRLDYVTGNFTEVNGIWGSYEGPIYQTPELRWLVRGSASRYDASEVGVARLDFQGDQWDAGGRLSWNFYQRRELFVDLFAGLRWRYVSVDDKLFGQISKDDFFLPEVGLLLTRYADTSALLFETSFEANAGSVAGTDRASLTGLGRLNPTVDFKILKWNAWARCTWSPCSAVAAGKTRAHPRAPPWPTSSASSSRARPRSATA